MVRDLVRQCTDDDHNAATISFFVTDPRRVIRGQVIRSVPV